MAFFYCIGRFFCVLWAYKKFLSIKEKSLKNFLKNIFFKTLDKFLKTVLLFYNVVLCGLIPNPTGYGKGAKDENTSKFTVQGEFKCPEELSKR